MIPLKHWPFLLFLDSYNKIWFFLLLFGFAFLALFFRFISFFVVIKPVDPILLSFAFFFFPIIPFRSNTFLYSGSLDYSFYSQNWVLFRSRSCFIIIEISINLQSIKKCDHKDSFKEQMIFRPIFSTSSFESASLWSISNKDPLSE